MSRFINSNAFAALSVEDGNVNETVTKPRRKANKSSSSAVKPSVKSTITDKSNGGPKTSLPAKISSKNKTNATAPSTTKTEQTAQPIEELNIRLKREGSGQYTVIAPGTPLDELHISEVESRMTKAKKTKITQHKSSASWTFGRKSFFTAGIALGLGLSAYRFAPNTMPPELANILSGEAMNINGLSNWLQGTTGSFPSLNLDGWGWDWEWKELASNLSVVEQTRKAFNSREFTAAEELVAKQPNITAHFPVILLPGIVSTGLEQWSASNAARGSFRKRLWSTTQMISAVLADRKAWMEALSLDPVTGLDPPNHKVRAASGLDAASEFIQGYWVWQRVIENLAAIGYDPLNMEMASYDWRLSYYNLEVRDAFFSRLKNKIELNKQITGRKSVIISHSMGGTVFLWFTKWVEADPLDDIQGMGFGGGGGPQWVEDHLEAHIGIASTLLGVPKSMTAFLSGEMKDTVEIHPAGSWVLEKFLSRKERANLFRRWPGSASMWMKGGDRIWGNLTWAADDPANCTDTLGRFFSFRQTSDSGPNSSQKPKSEDLDAQHIQPNLTMNEAGAYTLIHTPQEFQKMYTSNYSNGFVVDTATLKANGHDHRKWSNPLEVQLPNAPSMKQYCMYGYGKPTERSYYYQQGQYEDNGLETEGDFAQCAPDELDCKVNGSSASRNLGMPRARKNWIDTEITVDKAVPAVSRGVAYGEGDGTVPLLSLGAMCVKGWKDDRWNPARIPVITHEFKHEPEGLDLRGGAKTADHIDLLGNTALNQAILKIVAGYPVEGHIGSDIESWSNSIDWDSDV